MKEKHTFPKRDLRVLPIGFQFLKEPIDKKELKKVKPKFIKVNAYETSMYRPSQFTKPISKIINR